MNWKQIPGFPGYMASDCGSLKAIEKSAYNHNAKRLCIRKERLLKGKPDSSGYISHCLKSDFNKKTWLAHRLIALAWIPNPNNKLFINHKNGIKTDNRVVNLEWVTKSENGVHAVQEGLHRPMIGETNGNRKLDSITVLAIRNENGTQKDIAKKYNIGRTTVGYIQKGKLWKHLC